jgi:hypothetical protein
MGTKRTLATQEIVSSAPSQQAALRWSSYQLPLESHGLTGLSTSTIDVERTTFLPPRPAPPRPEVVGVYTETIREWWSGRILDINFEERFFQADLRDIAGLHMTAEFDFDVAFEGLAQNEIVSYLYLGSEFIYYVIREHGFGAPSTKSSIEFIEPHIWTVENQRRADEEYEKLFLEDPFDM